MLRALPQGCSGARGGASRRAAPARAPARPQRAPRRRAAAPPPRPRARPADDAEPVPPALLPPLASAAALDAEAAWLAGILRVYLDEEWLAQPAVHGAVGDAAGEAYAALRRADHARPVEVGDVVLAVAQALAAQQGLFRDAFCGPFDIANAVAELLMLRRGADCGCGVFSAESVARFEAQLAAERTAAPRQS